MFLRVKTCLCMFKNVQAISLLLTLKAHAREGYSSHFVSLLFHSGEGADFKVETYISIHSRYDLQ